MHYANGRAAAVGDIVRGKGYNIKHEIIGLLITANPGASACNCSVATVSINSQLRCFGWKNSQGPGLSFSHSLAQDGERIPIVSEVVASIEHGQLDAFVALDPETGEVLPPAPDLVGDAVKADAVEQGITVGEEIIGKA